MLKAQAPTLGPNKLPNSAIEEMDAQSETQDDLLLLKNKLNELMGPVRNRPQGAAVTHSEVLDLDLDSTTQLGPHRTYCANAPLIDLDEDLIAGISQPSVLIRPMDTNLQQLTTQPLIPITNDQSVTSAYDFQFTPEAQHQVPTSSTSALLPSSRPISSSSKDPVFRPGALLFNDPHFASFTSLLCPEQAEPRETEESHLINDPPLLLDHDTNGQLRGELLSERLSQNEAATQLLCPPSNNANNSVQRLQDIDDTIQEAIVGD